MISNAQLMLGLLAPRNKAKLLEDINTSALAAKDPVIICAALHENLSSEFLRGSDLKWSFPASDLQKMAKSLEVWI